MKFQKSLLGEIGRLGPAEPSFFTHNLSRLVSVLCVLMVMLLASPMEAQDALGQKLMTVKTLPELEFSKTLSFYEMDTHSRTVHYTVRHEAERNPYTVSYDYDIRKEESGYSVNPKALMDHLDLYVDESVKLRQSGDYLLYPTHIKEGDVLEASKSELHLIMPNVNWTYKYEIIVKDRKALGSEMIEWNGQQKQARLISSTLEVIKYVGEDIVEQKSEKITESYIEGFGPVEIQRGAIQKSDDTITYRTTKL